MPLEIKIEIDTRDLEKKLGAFKSQLRFATARTLTKVARQAVIDLQGEMRSVFDRPTPWTMQAFYAKPATTRDLTAWVGSREFAPKGRPAEKYLAPEIMGGTRGMKGFENALIAISGGQYVMPGKGAQLDMYGNLNLGQLVQILSRMSAMRDPTANISDKTTAKLRKKGLVARGRTSEYFVARERGNGRPLGIWKLVGRGQVLPILVFTPKPPHYDARLPFGGIVRGSISKNWEPIADTEIANAIATARLK